MVGILKEVSYRLCRIVFISFLIILFAWEEYNYASPSGIPGMERIVEPFLISVDEKELKGVSNLKAGKYHTFLASSSWWG